jgi:hypothetical protein
MTAAIVKTTVMAAGVVYAPTPLIVPAGTSVELAPAMPELAPVVLGTIEFLPVMLVPALVLAVIYSVMFSMAIFSVGSYADTG